MENPGEIYEDSKIEDLQIIVFISKDFYIELAESWNQYNNTHYTKINMKPKIKDLTHMLNKSKSQKKVKVT